MTMRRRLIYVAYALITLGTILYVIGAPLRSI